ncbi:MAG: hypothetical protein OQK69_03870, partial [Gammaproteobacteria bacterium]|nr:hypothetical protein [Gammaproteobacteria bacterium]
MIILFNWAVHYIRMALDSWSMALFTVKIRYHIPMTGRVNIQFYHKLNDFLLPEQRGYHIAHELKQPRSV